MIILFVVSELVVWSPEQDKKLVWSGAGYDLWGMSRIGTEYLFFNHQSEFDVLIGNSGTCAHVQNNYALNVDSSCTLSSGGLWSF